MAPAGSCVRVCLVCWCLPVCIRECVCVCALLTALWLNVPCQSFIFCGRKWWRGDSRLQRRPTRSRPLPHSFFLHQFRASQSIDVGVSVSYPCKVIPLSDEVGLWDMIKKVKTKRQVCPWKMGKISWKPKQGCGAPRIDLDLSSWSWSDDCSRLAIFQVQLRIQ